MAVKIRLKRLGKIREPHYRIVVADARTKRDGRAIEEIGRYSPKQEPSLIEVNSERVQYWLSVGAQPTNPVRNILSVTGDWQRFKGLPSPPPMRTAEVSPDKKVVFEKAAKEAAAEKEKSSTKSGSSSSSSRTKSRRSEKAESDETESAEKSTQSSGRKSSAKKAKSESEETAAAEQGATAEEPSAAGQASEGQPKPSRSEG